MTSKHEDVEGLLAAAKELVEEAEELLDEVLDLEAFAQEGRKPPRARQYRFKVNETIVLWPHATITGRQVLEAAGLTPPEKYILRLKVKGSKPEIVELDDPVDLRRVGVEKFRAIERGQGEGEYNGRRDAPTIDQDEAFLTSYGLPWEVVLDGSTWILMHNFPLPEGYTQTHVTLAIRMEGGYPFTPLDMMYVFPRVARADGKPINAADVMQAIDGVDYQRWSRHRTEHNPWVAGQDSLETHIYLVEEFFREELLK